MRIRLFGAVIALAGCAALAVAQQPGPGAPPLPVPTQPPPGMTPVPPVPAPAALPAYPTAPPIQYANPACGTPAPACDPGKDGKKGSLFGKLFIGKGTANPVACGCLASERTFFFGGCRQFYTPGRTCGGCALDYGPGGVLGGCDSCRHVTSFLNR
jgi:hypothetical protein